MGIDMADEISAHASNARGHWERWEIVEFHDRILAQFNRAYFGPFHDFSLPVAWWADPRASAIKREIIAFLEKTMDRSDFGFKDPRTIRLMPLWHQIFNELNLEPKVILCLRDPRQVARSLQARDGLDLAVGEYRWLTYMTDFVRYSSSLDYCTVEYEGWFTDPLMNFEKLKNFLGLQWQQSELDLRLTLSSLIDPDLRHDSFTREPSQPLIRSLYEVLRGCGGEGTTCKQTSQLVEQFIGFQKLHEPFQRAFESVAEIAAKLPQVEHDAADLRAADEALRADVEQRTAREAVLQREIEQRAAREAALRAEIEQRAATEAGLRCALDQAKHESEIREVRAEAVQAEMAAIRDVLAKTDRLLQEHSAAREVLHVELELAQDKLSDAQDRELTHHSALAALQADVNLLRLRLAEAEQRDREGEAATALRLGEMASLRGELAAARDVGKAALAALRVTASISPSSSNPEWPGAMLRCFGQPDNNPLPSSG
jgi:hypothetical protein